MSSTTQIRPTRTYVTGALIRTLRAVTLLGAILVSAWILVQYPSMPEIVPTHFDLTGQPDDFSEKTSVLWISGVMVAMIFLIMWLSTKPKSLNYPNAITEENAQFIYREGERMMVCIAAALLLIYLGIALTYSSDSGAVLVTVGMFGLLGVLVSGIVRIIGAGRKTTEVTERPSN
ncbi:MAG: DUF1648 domain-containing protein [Glutamicibacter sp.]